MTLPKQINPCPINEAVVGIKFESSLPSDAIFGVVYNQLKDSYQTVEQLPILQIPEAVRNNDPNLIFQSHYRLSRENFAVQLGPKVFSIAIIENYTTWQNYLNEIQSVFKKIGDIGFITNVSRVGLRYINFFESDIWGKLKVNVKIIEKEIADEEVFVRTVLQRDEFKVLLQTGNRLNLERNNEFVSRVSIIDIDTFIQEDDIKFFENLPAILEKAHGIEKELFFGLLKEDFLESLSPEY
ncbi:MAG: TIGR04255 family protein [Acidobacteriota bacterium]|nr:TIGR04255 family protein [Acidobacteriota bacterium]